MSNGEILAIFYAGWALALGTGMLWRLIAGPRCAHAWQLVDKTELPSRLEVIQKHFKPSQMYNSDFMEAATVRATIVMRCDRCGAAKIIHMTNK